MRPRTRRQREIFDFISDFTEKNGHDPSYNQIALHFRLRSKSAVAKHIEALERQGLLRRERVNGRFKLDLGPEETTADIVCKIEWLELPKDSPNPTIEKDLLVPRLMIGNSPPHTLRALVIPNNSMLEDGIENGDIAILEKRTFARDGACVAAEIPGREVVMSKFRRNGARIELVPRNDAYDTLTYAADEVAIRGVYRGLIKPVSQ